MGLSTPVRKLFCSKCKEKYWGKCRHFDIEVLGQKGEGVECRCRQCGHKYITYSRAAFRQTRYAMNVKSPNEKAMRRDGDNPQRPDSK